LIQALLEQQTWVDVATWQRDHAEQCDDGQKNVLSVTNTLTRFLERKYALKLDVCLHDQFVDKTNAEEARLLNIDEHDPCLRRKVSLLSRKEVMFDAESVLPLDILPAALMEELEQGKRPLANLLSDRGLLLSRSDLSIALIQEGFYDQCWARRSVLCSESGAKALVTEVFQDAIWRKINYLAQR